MYDLFKCKKLFFLNQKKSIIFTNKLITIVNLIYREINKAVLLILVTSHHRLIIFWIDRNSKQESTNREKLIKSIPFDKSKGSIKDLCFDNDNLFLFVAQEDGSIFQIPIFEILEELLQTNLPKTDGSLLTTEKLNHLTSIVYWKSDHSKQGAIIAASSDGVLTFIDSSTRSIFKKIKTELDIVRLSLIVDSRSTSLIISSQKGKYYRLILEEHYLKTNGFTFNLAGDQIRSYFVQNYDNNMNHYNNFKPSIIDLSKKERCANTQLFLDSNLVLNLVTWPQKDIRKLQVYSCHELDYNLCSPTVYLIKESSCIDCIILTERMIVYSNTVSCFILSKQVSEVSKNLAAPNLLQTFSFTDEKIVKICKLSKKEDEILDHFLIVTSESVYEVTPCCTIRDFFISKITQSSCIPTAVSETSNLASILKLNFKFILEKVGKEFLEKGDTQTAYSFYEQAKSHHSRYIIDLIQYHYFAEAIDYIETIFEAKLYEVNLNNRAHFAYVAIQCYLSLLLSNTLSPDDKAQKMKSLKKSLKYNQWYSDRSVIKILIEYNFFDLALYCAQVRCCYSTLVYELLNYRRNHLAELKSSFIESDSKSIYFQFLHDIIFSTSYFKVLSSSYLIIGLIEKPSVTGTYLRNLIKLFPKFDLDILNDIAKNFDPRQINIHLLIYRSLPQLKHQYLVDCELGDEEAVQKKDLINFFILVLLIIFRYQKISHSFDDRLLNLSFSQLSSKPAVKDIEWKRVLLSAGRTHCALIKNGLLYLWGRPDFGVLGNSNSSIETNPMLVSFFSETLALSVRDASCGANHTLVLTDYGCFAFGSSKYGQLGLGQLVEQTHHPTLIQTLVNHKIVAIYCGQYHSLAISAQGTLYSWGWGVHGQLGHGSAENVFVPKKVKALKTKKIVSAVGGYSHSLALDSNGIVYSWGSSDFGQLGFGNKKKHSIPKPLVCLNKKIEHISGSYFHNLAVTEKPQKLYIWGCNPYQIRNAVHNIIKKSPKFQNHTDQSIEQTLGYLSPRLIPIVLQENESIIKISTGVAHSALLTSRGKLYTWGRGSLGQLGLSFQKEVLEPTRVLQLEDYHVIDIASGFDFTLAIDNEGDLWGFGQNLGLLSVNTINSSHAKLVSVDKERKTGQDKSHHIMSFISRITQNDYLAFKINFTSNQDDYLQKVMDSIMDLNQFDETSNYDTQKFLTTKSQPKHDQLTLASIIYLNRSELDLDSLLNRCLSFDNFQCAAIVYELKGKSRLAMEAQLKALSAAYHLESSINLAQKSKAIFYSYLNKFIFQPSQAKELINVFIEFWLDLKLDQEQLEQVILNSFQSHIHSFTFGVIFFQFLDDQQNCALLKFSNRFILNLLSVTLEKMDRTDIHELNSVAIMNLMSSANDGHFPLEIIWQNILQNLQKPTPVRKKNDN